VFLTAYNEVTVSALLWSTGTETIGTVIYNLRTRRLHHDRRGDVGGDGHRDGGLMGLLDLLGRRLPPGVVPWRL
jgi:iron(III) transport system permease protein